MKRSFLEQFARFFVVLARPCWFCHGTFVFFSVFNWFALFSGSFSQKFPLTRKTEAARATLPDSEIDEFVSLLP